MLISVLSALWGLGLGIFAAVFPERAANWGRRNVSDLPPNFRVWYLRALRLVRIISTVFTSRPLRDLMHLKVVVFSAKLLKWNLVRT